MPDVPSSSPELVLALGRPAEVVSVQIRARKFAAAAGLSTRAQWELAIAVSEAATNMIKYAGGGVIVLRQLDAPRAGVEFEARDEGAGIASLERAIQDHVSDDVHRSERADPRSARGLGLGLGAIHRLMDEVVIDAGPGRGTSIRGRKWR
ncbi:MAG: ATP-binding protein [Nannocystaceae bacterium]